MYIKDQMLSAAMMIGHLMDVRTSHGGYKTYPAAWNTDLAHFCQVAADIAGLKQAERQQFVDEVTVQVNAESKK